MTPKRVLVVFGTRPETIKLAPVVEELRRRKGVFETVVAVTAQHREMLDQALGLFGITPDFDLDIMTAGQSLTDITVRALSGMSPLLEEIMPDAVVVQGDTTTTFVSALAAFYHQIPVGHVEAGLRTHDLGRPFPEEANRVLTSRLARWHWAPTRSAADNLLDEGVDPGTVKVTGNTVIDALMQVVDTPYDFGPGAISSALESGRRIVLVTAHRRENWGQPYRAICEAVAQIAAEFEDVHVLFATHRNPIVLDIARSVLNECERVDLIGPQDYLPFVKLMQAATLILSDSGGVQEEAPSLGKPVLVLREATERPEAVEVGVVRLVGTDRERIIRETRLLLSDKRAYDAMAQQANPFGDGCASARIVEDLEKGIGR